MALLVRDPPHACTRLLSLCLLSIFCGAICAGSSNNVVVLRKELLSAGSASSEALSRRQLLQADPFRPCSVNFSSPEFTTFDTLVRNKCPRNPARYQERVESSRRRCCPPIKRLFCKYAEKLNTEQCVGDSFFDELENRNYSRDALPTFCLSDSKSNEAGVIVDCTKYGGQASAPAPAPAPSPGYGVGGDGDLLDSPLPAPSSRLPQGEQPPPNEDSPPAGIVGRVSPPFANLGSLNPPPQSDSRRRALPTALLSAAALCSALMLPLIY